jgi:hypothetical protein
LIALADITTLGSYDIKKLSVVVYK